MDVESGDQSGENGGDCLDPGWIAFSKEGD